MGNVECWRSLKASGVRNTSVSPSSSSQQDEEYGCITSPIASLLIYLLNTVPVFSLDREGP